MVGALIVIVDRQKKTVYLAQNKDGSLPNWYGLTGRFFAGESEETAAQRIFRSNTTVNLPVDRLEFIGMNRCIWSRRRKEPQDLGRDRLYFTYAVELTTEEMKKAQLGLKPRKYERRSLRELTWDQMHDAGLHESMLIFHRRVFPVSFPGNLSRRLT
ncbi:MAG: NUDIX domain-containing protein [Candidatus Magasanikbacteria bacterium]|nr:NUDIX domain-containing protein [Candidatus Magasanikbacteria bacterium]